MSYESNDERMERLEQKFTELLGIQKAMLKLNLDKVQHQRTLNISFLKEAVFLKNNQDALVRYISSSSLITDEVVRRQFLDEVSRWESASEKMEKMLADLEKEPPEPLPPDEPAPPGPAE